MMKIESTVMIYVEMSINALSQCKEISNCGIPSVNQTTVRIDVGEDGKKKRNNYPCKKLLPLPLRELPVFAQSNLIKSLCPVP